MTYQASMQGTLFDSVPTLDTTAMEKRVRIRLTGWLEMARAAEKMPWNRLQAEKNEIWLEQSSNWLPQDEREAQRAAFKQEMARLRATG
jgi:hypothetical protein